MSFWDGMELWEKMLFVLAAAIVCTLIFAIIRLFHNNRRIRKHSKLAAARRSHLESMRSSRHVIQLKADEIPFGIKALEAGIQVEGVVVSQSATPTDTPFSQSQQTLVGSDSESINSKQNTTGHVRPQASTLAVTPVKPMVYQPSPYISLPAAVHRARSGSSSMRSSTTSVASVPPSADMEFFSDKQWIRSGSPIQFDVLNQLVNPPPSVVFPDAATLARLEGKLPYVPHRRSGLPRTRSPPAALHLSHRNSYSPQRSPSSSGTGTPPEERTPTLPSVSEDSPTEDLESRDSDSSFDGEGHQNRLRPQLITAYTAPEVTTVRKSYSSSGSGDLTLLHSHRLSHAAEVGQLFPRSRAPQVPGMFAEGPDQFDLPRITDSVYALDIAIPLKATDKNVEDGGRLRATSDPSLRSAVYTENWKDSLCVAPLSSVTADLQQAFDEAVKQRQLARRKHRKLRKARISRSASSSSDGDSEEI